MTAAEAESFVAAGLLALARMILWSGINREILQQPPR